MRIRVGEIPYLNSLLFYCCMGNSEVELIPMVPSALSRAAVAGQVDAGPVPLVTCFDLEDRYQPLGDYCIATRERARSILFFSRRPLEELDDAVVGVTDETSTSVRLLQVLLERRFRVSPRDYVYLQEPNDAFLLIGDAALKGRGDVPSYPHRYDLGEEWHRWTGLPFVFARWVARRDLEPEATAHLDEMLGRSLEEGLTHLERHATSRPDLEMTRGEVIEYIRNFHYRLGPQELEAIEQFRELLATIPEIPMERVETRGH